MDDLAAPPRPLRVSLLWPGLLLLTDGLLRLPGLRATWGHLTRPLPPGAPSLALSALHGPVVALLTLLAAALVLSRRPACVRPARVLLIAALGAGLLALAAVLGRLLSLDTHALNAPARQASLSLSLAGALPGLLLGVSVLWLLYHPLTTAPGAVRPRGALEVSPPALGLVTLLLLLARHGLQMGLRLSQLPRLLSLPEGLPPALTVTMQAGILLSLLLALLLLGGFALIAARLTPVRPVVLASLLVAALHSVVAGALTWGSVWQGLAVVPFAALVVALGGLIEALLLAAMWHSARPTVGPPRGDGL
ncbi:hypothetical protein LLH23_18655 [bacterium]|nr:hypothetical protein [bacterium]